MEKIDLKEDRDFFTREFRKSLITESTGGYLRSLLGTLRQEVKSLVGGKSATGVSLENENNITGAINNLEKVMKKNLKGKGLIGW